MPRYWLESTDGATLMQIQGNAFLVNWRRRNTEYPHFEAVKGFFDSSCRNFFSFLEEELHETVPRVQLAELTYINSIEKCEYWSSLLDTSIVLPRFALPVPTQNETSPADFHQLTIDRVAADTTLQTTVRSARSSTNSAKPVLIFELRAIGLIAENDGINEWFQRAHDLTGRRFAEMTNPDIQTTYWQPPSDSKMYLEAPSAFSPLAFPLAVYEPSSRRDANSARQKHVQSAASGTTTVRVASPAVGPDKQYETKRSARMEAAAQIQQGIAVRIHAARHRCNDGQRASVARLNSGPRRLSQRDAFQQAAGDLPVRQRKFPRRLERR